MSLCLISGRVGPTEGRETIRQCDLALAEQSLNFDWTYLLDETSDYIALVVYYRFTSNPHLDALAYI